jgi:hypothetical protein
MDKEGGKEGIRVGKAALNPLLKRLDGQNFNDQGFNDAG